MVYLRTRGRFWGNVGKYCMEHLANIFTEYPYDSPRIGILWKNMG